MTITRRKTRRIVVGTAPVGGSAPITVQSMTNTPTDDIEATVSQIKRLTAAGCEIIRIAVPDDAAARSLRAIKASIDIPLIADIHFDYRLAVASIEAGADGIRINPGNIGGAKNIKKVTDAASQHDVAIRIGVNAGSLEKDLLKTYGRATAEAMVKSAVRHIRQFESFGFDRMKVSIKSSDVMTTVDAYRMLSSQTDYPMHVGVTEAGSLYSGVVKSSIGIGMLLAQGIGDTIRVSLTRDPVEEVRVGFEILKALGIRRVGPEIVSCPTCGRCRIDLFTIVEQVEKRLLTCRLPIKIAVMGCVVNGPGEAREADIGIAGGDGLGILFSSGKVIKKFPEDQLVEVLIKEVENLERNRRQHET
ncbi:MAG: flavodoxin-dependent (E)-4-hydroxy-3-methylbut-2-enyl-diphosphate synthase [Desulfobacterales bacterium]